MTVSQRKKKEQDTQQKPEVGSGIRFNCDICSADVTHIVRMRCAETHVVDGRTRLVCPDFDICTTCFLAGKATGRHKPWHAYRVIGTHAFPIFDSDWGADEELLLLEGLEIYGLGNWADASDHVGGRTKEECMEHYIQTYIESENYPLPEPRAIDDDPEAFQARKRRRLDDLATRPLQLPPPKPMASAPTCHDIAGYMPGRLEFEVEIENDAETLIKDMSFGRVYHFGGDQQPNAKGIIPTRVYGSTPQTAFDDVTGVAIGDLDVGDGTARNDDEDGDEDDDDDDNDNDNDGAEGTGEAAGDANADANADATADASTSAPDAPQSTVPDNIEYPDGFDEPDDDLELKLAIISIFNDKYDRRHQVKDFIFDRGLLHYKNIVALERKRASKDERELVQRLKVFARIQSAEDFEHFVAGLLYESQLRKRILELQEYRRLGFTTIAECDQYAADRARGWSRRDAPVPKKPDAVPLGPPTSAGRQHVARLRHWPRDADVPLHLAAPSLAGSPSYSVLSARERALCHELKIMPRPYLYLKHLLLTERLRLGWLTPQHVHSVLRTTTHNGDLALRVATMWDSVSKVIGI